MSIGNGLAETKDNEAEERRAGYGQYPGYAGRMMPAVEGCRWRDFKHYCEAQVRVDLTISLGEALKSWEEIEKRRC